MLQVHFLQVALHWVLVKVHRAQTHRAAQHVPGWQIGGALSMGVSDYDMESLIVWP
jgi:hypothetical protein